MKRFISLTLLLLLPVMAFAEGTLTQVAAPPTTSIRTIVRSGIPFIKSSSGTMGNNGAISAMTALPRIYSGGAWIYLPAGAICAACTASVGGGGAGNASAVGWYWFVGSSTTAGTVYNSNYTTGIPVIGTTTALAETGPGAYAGITGAITALSVTVPGNSMGINGQVVVDVLYSHSNVGTNLYTIQYGGITCMAVSQTTVLTAIANCTVANRGNTAQQSMSGTRIDTNSVGLAILNADATQDSTVDKSLTILINCSAATDGAVIERYAVEVRRGA